MKARRPFLCNFKVSNSTTGGIFNGNMTQCLSKPLVDIYIDENGTMRCEMYTYVHIIRKSVSNKHNDAFECK
jgi:hypothetical protein